MSSVGDQETIWYSDDTLSEEYSRIFLSISHLGLEKKDCRRWISMYFHQTDLQKWHFWKIHFTVSSRVWKFFPGWLEKNLKKTSWKKLFFPLNVEKNLWYWNFWTKCVETPYATEISGQNISVNIPQVLYFDNFESPKMIFYIRSHAYLKIYLCWYWVYCLLCVTDPKLHGQQCIPRLQHFFQFFPVITRKN